MSQPENRHQPTPPSKLPSPPPATTPTEPSLPTPPNHKNLHTFDNRTPHPQTHPKDHHNIQRRTRLPLRSNTQNRAGPRRKPKPHDRYLWNICHNPAVTRLAHDPTQPQPRVQALLLDGLCPSTAGFAVCTDDNQPQGQFSPSVFSRLSIIWELRTSAK